MTLGGEDKNTEAASSQGGDFAVSDFGFVRVKLDNETQSREPRVHRIADGSVSG